MRIRHLFALCVLFFGLFSFNAMAQTCIQQGGTFVGCVSPIGITYGNATVGYFSSELAAVQAQGQYYLQNKVSCKECYNLGVALETHNFESWGCYNNIVRQNTHGYTKMGPEGKSASSYTWVYETRVYLHGLVMKACPTGQVNTEYPAHYGLLDANSVYAYIRCPANYTRTAGGPVVGQPYLGYLCRPQNSQTVTNPQSDFPNKDCADQNPTGSRKTSNPIDLKSKCKNEVVADLTVPNSPYPLQWLRFSGQRNANGVWEFEGQRSLTVSSTPFTTGSLAGKLAVSLGRRNGGNLVFTADPVTSGARQWSVTTDNVQTSLKEIANANGTDHWIVNQRNGEQETYDKNGVFVRKTSPSGHNHHYIYNYTNPALDGNGQRLQSIRDDFGNVLNISYNSGYTHSTSVPEISDDPVAYSPEIISTMSSSLPVSVTDGHRNVSYTWNVLWNSAFQRSTPQLLGVEAPNGGIVEYYYGEAFPNYTNVSKNALTGVVDEEGNRWKTYKYIDNGTASTYAAEWMGAGPDEVGALQKLTFDSINLTDQDGNSFGINSTSNYFNYSKKCPDCTSDPDQKKYYRYSTSGVYETENWSGVKNSIAYDAFGRVVKTIAAYNKTAVSQTVEYTYDANGIYREPLTQTETVLSNGTPYVRTTTNTYSNLPASYGAQSPCSGAFGGVNVPCSSTRRLLTKITVSVDDGSSPRETLITYTPYGLKDTVTLPTGQVIKYQWNEKGQMISVTFGYGTVLAQTYIYGGHTAYGPSYKKAPNNLITMWERDINGRIVKERVGTTTGSIGTVVNGVWVPSSGGQWRSSTYHWRLNNLLDWAETADGRKMFFTYDGARRVTQIQAKSATNDVLWTRALTWSPAGSLLSTQVLNGSNQLEWQESATYNAVRDIAQMVDGNNNATTLGYNSNYLNASVTSPLSNTNSQAFDDLDRPTTFTDAIGNIARLTYGPQNEVLTAKDQRLVETTYAYNGFGDLIRISSPDRGTWTFTYNNSGQLTHTTDPRGVDIENSYDALDRLTQRHFSGGGGTGLDSGAIIHQFVYGSCSVNQMCSMSDGSGTTHYTYNVHGDITHISWTDGNGTLEQSYTYTPDGKVETVVYPSGKQMVYQYGADGLPSRLTYNSTPVVTNIHWTATNAVKEWTWGQAIGWSGTHNRVVFNYDLTGQPISIEDKDQRTLIYDEDKRLIAVDDGSNLDFSQVYEYDKNNRLKSADIGLWNTNKLYSYDPVGNRTSLLDGTLLNGWQYTYGTNNNRLMSLTPVVSVGTGATTTPIYDAMGNMIADGDGRLLRYNTEGRLSSVLGVSNVVYTYNALGQRVSKSDGNKTVFIHDIQGRLMGEYLWTGSEWNTTSEYMYLDSWRAVAVVRPDSAVGMSSPHIHPVLSDHLGTPRKVLDGSTGQTLWSWDAKDPFGHELPQENPEGLGVFVFDIRFPGQQFDKETGLFHNGFRTYSPKWGRYIQSDPLGLEAGWNTYVYVGGNPLAGVDPLGLKIEFKDNVKKIGEYHLNRLKQMSPFANLIIETLEAEGEDNIIISRTHAGSGQLGNNIEWDPCDEFYDLNGNLLADGAISLFHELFHIAQYRLTPNYASDLRDIKTIDGNLLELQAIKAEGIVAKDMGFSNVRTSHNRFNGRQVNYRMYTRTANGLQYSPISVKK